MQTRDSSGQSLSTPFVQRTLTVIALTVLFLLLLSLAGLSAQILLLVLGSVLLTLPLRAAAHWLSRKTGWRAGLSLLLVCALLLGVLTGLGWFMSGAISQQINALREQLPGLMANARKQLSASPLGQQLLDGLSTDDLTIQQVAGKGNWFGRVFGAVSSAFDVLSNLYIVFFLTVFILVSPHTYRQGIVLLVPPAGRDRANEVLDQLGDTLLNWLLGQLFSMTVVGILTAVGLWLLGIPLVAVLALLAALLSFIPNLGPILALVPALLVAFTSGPQDALYVAGLYLGVQAVESNFITPFVQQRLIEMPPALILVAQVIMGTLLGLLGVMLATPIVAIIMVLVKMLYIRDGLGDTTVQV